MKVRPCPRNKHLFSHRHHYERDRELMVRKTDFVCFLLMHISQNSISLVWLKSRPPPAGLRKASAESVYSTKTLLDPLQQQRAGWSRRWDSRGFLYTVVALATNLLLISVSEFTDLSTFCRRLHDSTRAYIEHILMITSLSLSFICKGSYYWLSSTSCLA